jgi:hypothetical protein
MIDTGEPVCVLLGGVLHFLAADEADQAVAEFRRWTSPGSYLVISAGTSTATDAEFLRQLQAACGDAGPVTGAVARVTRRRTACIPTPVTVPPARARALVLTARLS